MDQTFPVKRSSRWRRLLLAGLAACALGGSLPAWPAEKSHQRVRAELGSSAAFAPDGRLWLVGVSADGRLFVQTAPARDLPQWEAPRLLDIGDDVLWADGENRPKLAFGPAGQVVISYTRRLARPYTGWIRMLRSDDGGRTFSAPFTVHADRQEITHRFDAIAFDAQGVLHTLWIDKRDLALAPKAERKSSYRGAAIYRNESYDGGASFGPDLKLVDHSCECCRLALAQGADGHLRAMWRHVFEPNVRDHAIAVFGGTVAPAVVRATHDDWRVDGCPHHGPGLAPAADGGFHAVWFGIRKQGGEDLAAVRYARLNADGSPRPETVRALPDDAAEHADVMASGRRVAVVWRSFTGVHSTLRAWLSTDDGKTFQLRELAQVRGDNDHPRLAQSGARMVVVWRNTKKVQVHELHF